MDAKRRLVVPFSLAAAKPGEAFEASYDADEDAFVFRRATMNPKEDWLEVLAECPVPLDEP